MTKKQILTGVLTAVLLLSTACLFGGMLENAKQQNAFNTLKEGVQASASEGGAPQGDPPAAEEPQPQILPQYAQLHAQNPDMAGWVQIEGTALSYPVMYTPEDVEHYLRRAFDQTDSIAGTPFIGYDCTLEPRSDNLLLYGHHMKNGTMFTAILSYRDRSFWQEHPVIEFDTLYEEGDYQVMAAFYVTATTGNGHFAFYNFTNAKSEEEFTAFVDSCKKLSLYDTGVTAEYGDALITLTTCSYHSENGRFVVVARKAKES